MTKNQLILVVFTVLALMAAFSLTDAQEGKVRAPVATMAEKAFFDNFNGGGPDRAASLRLLMAAYATDPKDARTCLLLGLNHLWIGAEGGRTDPRLIEHLILSERFLAEAQRLDPSDRRIPSWLVPVRLALAGISRDPERKEEIESELLAAYAEDPAFHSFTVALLGFTSPKDSKDFTQGLEALRGVDPGCEKTDPSCRNEPRWPHNQEGYLTFWADYELKAGHKDRARDVLTSTQKVPSYASWKYRGEVEDRLKNLELNAKLYADQDPGNDPPTIMSGESGFSCQSCHRN
ncbi:MAG TPA: hypothetical protein VG477_05035 [Thermoanaerobaculia bacterium]|nr:hypothetical protein [Thermoanaerobaculia bacterium]